jgi:septum formation protein
MTTIDTAPFLGLPLATITLASASVTRKNILRAAGVDFNVVSTAIDEARVRADAQAGDMAADEIAVLLAFLKAQAASQTPLPTQSSTKSSYIIGCDQLLLIDDHIMAKPESLTEAKQQLDSVSGIISGALR